LSNGWLQTVDSTLGDYLEHVRWSFDKTMTLNYINKLQQKYSVCSYRKKVYQIRKFLLHNNIDWAKNIVPPIEPEKQVKYIKTSDIDGTIKYFENHERQLQLTALIRLGADTGARPEELYQLNPKDIDLKNRTIYINHLPEKNQTTKTKRSRVSFFSDGTRKILKEYLWYHKNLKLSRLFEERYCQRQFKDAPIKVKHLRKYFSQTWTRKGGSTGVKKILMGHSLKGDVDLQHYDIQTNDDLKKIYEKVMSQS